MRLAFFFFLFAPAAWAAHAYSQFGDIKYPAGFKHFEWVNPDAPKGGDIELVPPLRITNFDKYNPFTLKGTSPPGLGALVFESLLTGTMDEPTTAYGLLAEDVDGCRRRAVGDLPAESGSALPERHAGAGGGREAQLRHADEQAGGAAVPGGVRRRAAGGGHRRAHGALRLQARQRRAAADGGRPAGVQPRLGRRQAVRPGGDGYADRQRAVQDRPPQLRPRHHLRARPEVLGARPQRAPRALQLRPHHLQDLQGHHRADRGVQGRRVRLPAHVSRRANGRAPTRARSSTRAS